MAVHFHVYKNIIQSFSNLISDETRKDVTFTFTGSDVTIKAHKCILETVSPVFKSMLSGNFTETDEVKIDDIRPEVFQLLMNGIYLQKINPKPQTFLNEVYAELYYAAEKYDIEDIREISKKFLINDCSSANVHWMLTKAKLFNIIDLETKCMAIFKDNTYKVLSIHIQLILDDEILSKFFDLHNLEIAQEYDLYVALEVMVDVHSLQNYSKCLRKIRFLTMDTKDIILCKLLTSDEKVAIISNIEARKSKEQPEVPMPSHLSPLRRPRISLKENFEPQRMYFWTAIMINCSEYKEYWNRFLKFMMIPNDRKELTRTLIINGRKQAKPNGYFPQNVVLETMRSIFP